MNTKTIRRAGLATFAALIFLAPFCASQIAVKPSGSFRIEGDSSLHKWSSTATVVAMSFRLADGAPPTLAEAIRASKVAGLEVRVSAAGLHSGEGSGMDKNMRAALKADKFPDIVYELDHYELVKGADGATRTAKAAGRLTIAGQTKDITMEVELRPGAGTVALRGSYTLDMSDFGIKPPTLMLGAIKVRDPVTIRFDLLLAPPAARKTGA
jgi:polyisoprenoid-binding protein YceI